MKCIINIKKFIPKASKHFRDFECRDFQVLHIELDRIIQFIQTNHPNTFFAIPIHITEADGQPIPRTLLKFITAQEQILFHICIDNAPELQSAFDTAYLESQKKWYALQINKQRASSALYLDDLCQEYDQNHLSYIHHSESLAPESFDLIEWAPAIPKKILPSQPIAITRSAHPSKLAAFLKTLENSSQSDISSREVITVFSEVLDFLFHSLGEEGLYYRIHQLKLLDAEQLADLSQIMFSPSQTDNIQILAHPNFEYYLEIINLWPKNLFFNWLTWYSNRSDELGLIESIEKVQAFWLDAYDYHPQIPRLENSGRACDFSQLIASMQELLTITAPQWKKIQLKFIFHLDWSEPQTIFRLKQAENLNWISSEILTPSHPLQQAYLYLAKHFSHHEEEAFKQVRNHLLIYQGIPNILKYITWLYTLKPLLTTEQVNFIIESPHTEAISHLLYAIPKEQIFSSITFLQMHQGQYEELLNLHALWIQKNTDSIQYAWTQWMGFYNEIERPKPIDLHVLREKSISQIYFYLILDNLSEGLTDECSLIHHFARLPEEVQKKLIQTFLSNEDKSRLLDLSAIETLLQDAELQTQIELCFKRHLPLSSFSYFNKATQFETVLITIKNMLKGLTYVIDCFSNDEVKALTLPGYSTSFKGCIQEGLVLSLQTINVQVTEIQALIQQLETQQIPESFQNLLVRFGQLETFIQDFLRKPLQGNLADFLNTPRLLLGNKPFISLFDDSLQLPGKTFKNLFEVMSLKFNDLKKVGIDQYFNEDIIRLLANANPDENHLELLMNDNLITVISSKIPQSLDDEKHQNLLLFLGKIQFNPQEIEQFFQRIKVIEYVNQQWPHIEGLLRRKNLSHQSVWKICVRHQCVNDLPYASTHWKICFELIVKLQDLANFEELLDKILQAKNKFPKKLDFEGQIDHPHWAFTIEKLLEDLQSDLAQSPCFFLMLEHAIAHHIQTGKVFDYNQFTVIFQKIREDARTKVMQLTHIRDASKTPLITSLLSKIREILNQSPSKSSIKFIEKLLLEEHLETHLPRIQSIFDWLEQEAHFPWLEIMIDDTDCHLEDILLLIERFQNMHQAWRTSYPTKPGIIISSPPTHREEVIIRAPITAKKSWLISAWGAIQNPKGALHSALQLLSQAKPVAAPPNPGNNIITQITPLNEHAIRAWKLWKRPFRPKVQMLSNCLIHSPNEPQISIQLTALDTWPSGEAKIFKGFEPSQLTQVIKDLESHTRPWAPRKKEHLLQRLTSVLTHFGHFQNQTVSQLLHLFETIKNQLNQSGQYNHFLEDEMIGILIALYYKTLAKMPYPTQIICLLITLEFGNKNLIFEVDTGEGKSIINAFLAILKAIRKENNTVIVRTANAQLVHQDFYQKKHYQFFQLLGIHCHELLEMSDMLHFKEGGIYYTSHLQFQILSNLYPSLESRNFDLIADEVDEILDQHFPMSLAKPHPKLKNMEWLYENVNEFVDLHIDKQHTPEKWIKTLQIFLFEKNKHVPKHLQKLRTINLHDKVWKKLLIGSFLSRAYISLENQNYIIKNQTTSDGTRYSILPYANGKPILDFHFGLDGLIQCLAKRLEIEKNIELVIPDFCESYSFLNPFNYKNITSLVGLSGSNGKVIELNQLTRAFNAESFRIGRFTRKKLHILPTILASGHSEQIEHLKQLISHTDQPILILCQNIQSANTIFVNIASQAPCHKSLMLLTGQESDSDRENWLYNQEAEKFAGQNHCITIGTSALGRGIDITPKHPHGLLVIKTYLEKNERTESQLNGRPARAGACGSIVSVLNRKILIEQFPEQKSRDIQLETLETHKAKLQKNAIIINTQQRLNEQLRLWCWSQLYSFLKQTLTEQKDIELCQPHLLRLFHCEWQKLQKHTSYNKEFYIDWLMGVWRQGALLNYTLGLTQRDIQDDTFRRQMRLSDWEEIINPDLQTTSFFVGNQALIPSLSLAQHDSQVFKLEFLHLKHLATPSKPKWYFSWLNPSAQQISNYLYESWEFFKKNDSSENFKYFYETLLSAKLLYKQQKKSTLLRVDYWFPSLNILLPWLELEQKLSNQLQIQNIHQLAEENYAQIEENLSSSLHKLFSVIAPENTLEKKPSLQHFLIALKNFFMTLCNQLMLVFYAEPKEHDEKIQNNIKNFKKQKNLTNLKNLHESFSHFLSFYHQMETAPWYFLPKYYWKFQFKTWKKEIESYFSQLPKETDTSQAFTQWLSDCSIHADFRLKCLGHLLHQEETVAQKQSFFGGLNSTDNILMTLHQQYLETAPEYTDLKLHEFGRFFKKELQQKWMASLSHDATIDKPLADEMADQSLYTELAQSMIKRHIQNQLSQSHHIKPSIRLKVLEDELTQTERNREFLPLLSLS